MNMRTKLIATVVLGAALLIPVAQAQRPDDRAGLRGPGAFASAQQSSASHPDNRAGMRGPGALAGEQRASVRPDDRAGARGPGAVAPGLVRRVSVGFDWGDALIGALAGAGTALLLTGCTFLLTGQRHRARSA